MMHRLHILLTGVRSITAAERRPAGRNSLPSSVLQRRKLRINDPFKTFLVVLIYCSMNVDALMAQPQDIAFENRNASGWFGGNNNSSGSGPRHVGVGQSVLIDTDINLDTFSFNFSGSFNFDLNNDTNGHAVTLTLNVRDSGGVILRTVQVNLPETFGGGWVTWSGINLPVDADSTLIFTTYLNGAFDVSQYTTGNSGDAASGYTDGVRYSKTGTSDADMEDWNGWFFHPWDSKFRLEGTLQSNGVTPYNLGYEIGSASGWFGGDSRSEGPQHTGFGQSVLIDTASTVGSFSFYMVKRFDFAASPAGSGHAVTLTLNVRDSDGVILRTVQEDLPETFEGGWVTWSGISLPVDANTTLIFTTYLDGAFDVNQFSTTFGNDAFAGYPDGMQYIKNGTGDADMEGWTGWTGHPRDATFQVRFDPLIVVVGTAFGAPGDTVRIPVTLTNQTAIPVGGLQFSLALPDTTVAHFIGIEDTLSNAGFTVSATTADDSTEIVIFSDSQDVITPGSDIPLVTLVYVLDPSAPLGSTVELNPADVVVEDAVGSALANSPVGGALQVGIRGDVGLDGNVSILDVIPTVRIILGKDATPATGSVSFNIADVNEDGAIDVSDVILQVNTILGIGPKLIATGPTTPVVVNLDAAESPKVGQNRIPVSIEANGVIAGVQARFTFDPSLMQVGTPVLAGRAEGLAFDSHIVDGSLRVVVFATTPGQGIASGLGPILYIPVTVREGVTGMPSLTLMDIILVDPYARQAPIQRGETAVTVRIDATRPATFALNDARPNPFNPSTTISYQVPQQSHITLTVYNLLGQEVVRLIDGVKQTGRYEVVWSGRNAHGRPVASGIYLFQLTSRAGFSETRRMTLLK